MDQELQIQGYCDPAFTAVKDVFVDNFTRGLEQGAAVAVTVKGEFLVDLWAGYADAAKNKSWKRDTIVNVFSTTKIMAALCVLILVDQGRIDLDSPVAKYWPEFAGAGKENIIVRWLLNHSSGIAGFDQPLAVEDLYNWDYIITLLEAQEPWWQPGTRTGYHAITFGFLLGELVKRISGKSLGTFFQEQIALPLQADFYIGLPQAEGNRVAELIPPLMAGVPAGPTDSLVYRVFNNPPVTPLYAGKTEWQAAELPASNGHGNARSAAKIGSILASRGELDGIRFLSQKTIAESVMEHPYDTDLVLGTPVRYGLGFALNQKELDFPKHTIAYWGGVGGSWLIMDLDTQMCFCYVMNKMVNNSVKDPRSIRLKRALFRIMSQL